ncbi:(deoxy)nucleoside triphosphate pyrophosphohydrolase [Marinilabilia salmonicolor]|uniref:(deoxy)nucleoside triphosphate pyrophosphohydrolase n=1 Tax=Marinilabilia salmonicolor TaxID=989 RepID=UPI001F2738BB|nr:(deoxy)nucleoside triphosphate pyrophosphohydrolase [Marinilabilia salmonicolor]
MKRIKVTCAIISFGTKCLVVQRGSEMNMPLKWEFPGGKVERGESEEACIKREIKEELAIEIELQSRLTPVFHDYAEISIELIPFLARYKHGEIQLREHKQYLLLEKKQLKDLAWAEADLPVLKEYLHL